MVRWMQHGADFDEFQEIGPDDTVIDIGCGAGNACVAAGRLGAAVVAVDYGPELIAQVEERMRGVPARSFRAIVSDCNPIPLPDAAATVVICTEVIEHVDDPRSFAAELARIGKPGARYIVSVPAPGSEALMATVVHPNYFKKPAHQHIFKDGDFARLLESVGLEVVKSPRCPNNFYWAIWCLLRAAGDPHGMAPRSGPPFLPPVLEDWNKVWQALEASPGGAEAITYLDALLPRSQPLIARKPGVLAATSPAHGPGIAARMKQLIKHGKVKMGRYEVHWNVRREAVPLGSGR